MVVTISYSDLKEGKDLTDKIYEAFGPKGLGALTISGVPDFAELRSKLLPLSYKIAHLPDEAKKTLEHEESMFNVGWSHGKEKLGDKPDLAKGSYYCNPLVDETGTEEERKKYPYFYPKNIWPTKFVPDLEQHFKDLGKVMFDVIVLLCKQIDNLVSKHVPTYPKDFLFSNISVSKKVKGRLLYYYPSDAIEEDSWIGWHNDSGFLTGLTSALYLNDETGEKIKNPDSNGGLWVVDRGSSPVKVEIPADHMGVQCGECLQIITGGLLVATPHSVNASHAENLKIGRATFPVFVDTPVSFPLNPPKGVSRDQVFDKTVQSKVPPLEKRWLYDGVSFAEFLGDTFKQYYEWTINKQNQK